MAAAPDLPAVREISEFLARYEKVRYAAGAPTPEVLADLDLRIRTILRELRTARRRRRQRSPGRPPGADAAPGPPDES